MRQALRDGQTEARVALVDAPITADTYGVGAIQSLEGEITIDAGTIWVSQSSAPGEVETTRDDLMNAATMLFIDDVPEWESFAIERDLAPDEIDAYLRDLIGNAGPHMFRIEGTLADLRLHVIAGECPIRARMLGEEMTSPPIVFELPMTQATIVGVFAEDAAGDITHMGSDTHMHVLLEQDGQMMTGHVESVAIRQGSTLQIPASR